MLIPMLQKPCRACGGAGTTPRPDFEAMRRYRESLGVSQNVLARETGWRQSVVSELESGARPMTDDSAERYWSALERVREKLEGESR